MPCVLLVTFAALFAVAPAGAAPSYTITDLGPANVYNRSPAINNRGDVAYNIREDAFLWSNGQVTALGTFRVQGVNNSGVVIGYRPTATGDSEGMIYSGVNLNPFPLPVGVFAAVPKAINDNGVIAGSFGGSLWPNGAFGNGVFRSDGSFFNLDAVVAQTCRSGDGAGIDSAGNVVGSASFDPIFGCILGNGYGHPFEWLGNSPIDLDPGSADFNGQAEAINDSGQVIGEQLVSTAGVIAWNATLWSGGSKKTLGPGQGVGIDANGNALWDGGAESYVYDGVASHRLLDQVPGISPRWHDLSDATAMNAAGQIVGVGTFDGVPHAFLLNLLNPNHAPVCSAYSGGVSRNQTLSDSVSCVDPDSGDPISVALTLPAFHGAVTLLEDGSFTYVPLPGYLGPDSFTFEATDGHGAKSGPMQATIDVFNAPPVCKDLTATTPEDVELSPRLDCSDPTSDPLTVELLSETNGHAACLLTTASGTCEPFDSILYARFAPGPRFTGTATFTFRAIDDLGERSNVATATITVLPAVPPHCEEAPYTVPGRPDDPSLYQTVVNRLPCQSEQGFRSATIVSLVSPPAHGAVAFGPGSLFRYDPEPRFHGNDSFSFMVDNSYGLSNVATVSLSVTDRSPHCDDGQYDFVVSPFDYPSLAEYFQCQSPLLFTENNKIFVLDGPSHGTVTTSFFLNQPPHFVYTPDPRFSGVDSFKFTLDNTFASSNVATVAIAVPDRSPHCADSSYSTPAGLAVQLLPCVSGIHNRWPAGTKTSALSGPGHGTLSLGSFQPDPQFTYQPAPGFSGTDMFTYVVDNTHGTAVAKVTITVTSQAPHCNDFVGSVAMGTILHETLDCADPDGDPLTYEFLSVTNGAVGCYRTDFCPSFTFTPTPGFLGTATFTYRVLDARGAYSNVATGTIDVFNGLPDAGLPPDGTHRSGCASSSTDASGSLLLFGALALFLKRRRQ
jgi:MYXO-CTERM domain-containing protein